MKSSRPSSAHWRSSNTRTTGSSTGRRSKNSPPAGEQPLAAAGRRLAQAEQRQQARLDPTLARPGPRCARRPTPRRARGSSPRRRSRRGRPACGPSRRAPRTLTPSPYDGERPSCQNIVSTMPSMYFSNSHASRLLPMPAWPEIDDEPRAAIAGDGVIRVLAGDGTRRRGRRTAAPAHRRGRRPRDPRDDAQRAPRGDRARPCPSATCSPAGSNAIAASAAARVASPDEHRPGRRHRLQPRAVFTRSPATMPLVRRRRASRPPRRSARRRGRRLEARPPERRRDRVDEVEGGPDGPLGIVLVRDRRAPHRHDRVADELLDRAAVATDDLARRARSSASAARGRARRHDPRRGW